MRNPLHSDGPWRRVALRRWVPYALLGVASALSLAASWYVASTAEDRVHTEFLADADATRQQIQARLDAHIDILRAGAALLTATNEIDGGQFRAFVAGLQLRERYQGMKGLGFAQHLRRADLQRFLRAVELDGVARFQMWPAGLRPEHDLVLFLEPRSSENRKAIGFDMTADATLVPVMVRARDNGQPVASPTLNGVPPFAEGPGEFIVVTPVYRTRTLPASIEGRRRALIGYVFSPFSPEALLQQAAGMAALRVTYDVYDGIEPTPSASVTAARPASGDHRYQSSEHVQIAGREWLVVITSNASRSAVMALVDTSTLLGGLLLSLLLFAVTRAQVRAWETAARHEAALRRSAQHDSLTGLPNRSLLQDRLTQAIALARRHNRHLAVLFVDLDHFKHINDSFGHATGDRLLQSAAGRLLACARTSDTVSRQGGDEFVVVLSEIERVDDAAVSAQKIINALVAPHEVTPHGLQITVSIGISLFPTDGRDAAALIKAADTAMYQAKEQGRNTYQFFKPDMSERAAARQWIEAGLRLALRRREFVLHYQPTINLETGAMTGAEALIRWMHPERGLIGPTEFVSIAEDSGLIVPMGQWVLREACAQARTWLDAGKPTVVAVNISAIEFRDKDFLANVCRVLEDSRLEPRYLELELTESVLMRHAESTVAVLRALKDIGVRIAIDDFGTGYSSLSYLRQFPIDVLKVDQSFVREITGDLNGTPIVSAMISMARNLRHRVIAEGVETREQLAFLQAQPGCEGQGFYFSQPVSADQFSTLLDAGPSPAILH